MRISTRFQLLGLFSAAIVALIIAALLATAQQVRHELANNESATRMLYAVASLRYLTLEYVLRHDERSQAQWSLRSASLGKDLDDTLAFSDKGEQAAILALRQTNASLNHLFGLLVDNQRAAAVQADRAVTDEFESRLVGQIANGMQAMLSNALGLSEQSRQGLLTARAHEQIAVGAFSALVILVVAATMLVAYRSVARPLEKLRKGTIAVGTGQLNFKLGATSMDEIGELARAFDGMTDKLRNTTVSRDELATVNTALQVEIQVRRQAEQKTRAQLARLDLLHQITRSIGERQDLRSIFLVIIRSLEDQLPIDFACICLYDHVGSALVVSCVGQQQAAQACAIVEGGTIAIDENGLSRCVAGELVYEPDAREVAFPFPQRLANAGLHALVLAPLQIENQVFGVLIAVRREANSFSSGECEFLRQLSEHVALAAKQAELYSALQRAYDEMRQAQQAAMQQERLRALGQMASGIAHDINNAISPVVLYTESLLETEAGLSDHGRGCLEVIKRSIEDVAATVARMREFYRARAPQMVLMPVNANALLRQVADLTRVRWSDMPQQRGVTIRLDLDIAPELPDMMGVEGEIREALTNLVFNAVDAMPDGGVLTLRTRAPAASARDGRRVRVEVGDSGAGMDEETRRRCLEPFFTTKGERGTGLGLAMVYGMVERHSAELDIITAPMQGTKVCLTFAAVTAGDPVHAPMPPSSPAQQRLRILAVDDDPLVLKTLCHILGRDGHDVVAADGGMAGIDTFRAALSRDEFFSVVITDLGMPYVDGRKVAQAIKEMSPATPVILLTGWGQRIVEEEQCPLYIDKVLGKPPKLSELRAALAAYGEPEA